MAARLSIVIPAKAMALREMGLASARYAPILVQFLQQEGSKQK